MSSSNSGASNAGKDFAETIKRGAAGIHGIGEVIRGNIRSAADGLSNDKTSQAENDKIIEKGINEIEDGHYRGHPESQPKF